MHQAINQPGNPFIELGYGLMALSKRFEEIVEYYRGEVNETDKKYVSENIQEIRKYLTDLATEFKDDDNTKPTSRRPNLAFQIPLPEATSIPLPKSQDQANDPLADALQLVWRIHEFNNELKRFVVPKNLPGSVYESFAEHFKEMTDGMWEVLNGAHSYNIELIDALADLNFRDPDEPKGDEDDEGDEVGEGDEEVEAWVEAGVIEDEAATELAKPMG